MPFSVAGHYAEAITIPISLYSASKYAVRAIGAGLKHEMNASKSPIKITVSALGCFGKLDQNCTTMLCWEL